jgi:Ca2+-transporting ATPase
MAVTTFALANLFFSFTARDELRSVFSLETFDDRRFLTMSAASVAAILFGTELRIFQKILHTESLSGAQWLVCIAVALSVLVVSEIRKAILRHRARPEAPAEPTPAADLATTVSGA